MKKNPGKSMDELCYPFVYEDSLLCDFEIETDELCKRVGLILSELPQGVDEVRKELEQIQPLTWHLNASIRGKCAITEEDQNWLLGQYNANKKKLNHLEKGFVLPGGKAPAPQLQLAGSNCKRAIRLMVKLERNEKKQIPDILYRFTNTLCNEFFVLSRIVNTLQNFQEQSFQSLSY